MYLWTEIEFRQFDLIKVLCKVNILDLVNIQL